MKICSKCGEEKFLSEFSSGRNACKECRKKYRKALHEANREKSKADSRAWREANPERRKIYYDTNREKFNAARRALRAANPEKIRANDKARRDANPKRGNAAGRTWYEANKKQRAVSLKFWREANPEKRKAYWHKRRAILLAIMSDLTSEEWTEIWAECKGLCFWCGNAATTMDHIVPLTPREEGQQGHNTKSNVIPACVFCNSRKNNKDPLLFLFELRKEV